MTTLEKALNLVRYKNCNDADCITNGSSICPFSCNSWFCDRHKAIKKAQQYIDNYELQEGDVIVLKDKNGSSCTRVFIRKTKESITCVIDDVTSLDVLYYSKHNRYSANEWDLNKYTYELTGKRVEKVMPITKFEVGDRVTLLKDNTDIFNILLKAGIVGVIQHVVPSGYYVRFECENKFYTVILNDFEIKEIQMFKQGDKVNWNGKKATYICKVDNSNKCIISTANNIFDTGSNYYVSTVYNEEITPYFDPEELTLEQVCKLLNRNIKIVK